MKWERDHQSFEYKIDVGQFVDECPQELGKKKESFKEYLLVTFAVQKFWLQSYNFIFINLYLEEIPTL